MDGRLPQLSLSVGSRAILPSRRGPLALRPILSPRGLTSTPFHGVRHRIVAEIVCLLQQIYRENEHALSRMKEVCPRGGKIVKQCQSFSKDVRHTRARLLIIKNAEENSLSAHRQNRARQLSLADGHIYLSVSSGGMTSLPAACGASRSFRWVPVQTETVNCLRPALLSPASTESILTSITMCALPDNASSPNQRNLPHDQTAA